MCGGPGGWHAVLDACVHILARSLLDSSGGHTIIEALAWITVVNLKSLHVCYTHTACYGRCVKFALTPSAAAAPVVAVGWCCCQMQTLLRC